MTDSTDDAAAVLASRPRKYIFVDGELIENPDYDGDDRNLTFSDG